MLFRAADRQETSLPSGVNALNFAYFPSLLTMLLKTFFISKLLIISLNHQRRLTPNLFENVNHFWLFNYVQGATEIDIAGVRITYQDSSFPQNTKCGLPDFISTANFFI